jgi:phenylacetate-CoA ligase
MLNHIDAGSVGYRECNMTTLDPRECRHQGEREFELMARLPQQIAYAKTHTSYFGELLHDIDPNHINTREQLATLPVTRKSDLSKQQKKRPPFGGMNAVPIEKLRRIFQSPGPIYEPQGQGLDSFRLARSLRAAGFKSGDLVHNTFSYHFTPGAWMMEGAAHALGCCVFPAGVGQTELQAQTLAHLKPNAYTGTPSFLKLILEKADELGLDASCLTKAMVSGEALTPSLRQWFEARGLMVLSAYATADLGLIAYESPALVMTSGGMIIDEDIVLEIVEPNGDKPVAAGEVGEVVVTVFDQDYPLIRFGTGDLSALDIRSLSEPAPCGRTNTRIKGWLGRADQTTKIKGMFVHPGQISEIVRKHTEVKKARVVVSGNIANEHMTIHCELDPAAQVDLKALSQAIALSTREITKLRAEVAFVQIDSLANDGRLIEDARTYA